MTAQAHATTSRAPPKPITRAPPHAGLLQCKCACGGSAGFSGQCDECGKKRFGLQRRAAGPAAVIAPPIVHEVLRSLGQPLDPATRAFMEPRFGHDFSKVRVHTDAPAAASAHTINALAFTVGDDIVFASDRYAPGTKAGKRLLAHELAHTIQQAPGIARQTDIIPAPPLDLGPGVAKARQYQPHLRPHVPHAPQIAPPPVPVASVAPLPARCPAAAAVTAALRASDVTTATETEMQRDINLAQARSAGHTTPMTSSILHDADAAIQSVFGNVLPSGRNLLAQGAVTTQTPSQFAQTRVPDAASAREHVAEAALDERGDVLRGLCITDSSDANLQTVVGGAIVASRGIGFVRDYQASRIGGQTNFPVIQGQVSPHVTIPNQSRNMGHIVVHEAMHFYVSDRYRTTAESDPAREKSLMEGGAEFLARAVINSQLSQLPEFAIHTGTYAAEFHYVADNLMKGGVDAFEQAYFQGRVDLLGLPAQPKLEVSQPGDALEQEADRVAEQVLAMAEPDGQTRMATASQQPGLLARQPKAAGESEAPQARIAGNPSATGAGTQAQPAGPQLPTCNAQAVNQWIVDPHNPKIQLFGLTQLSGAGGTQPEFKVGPAPGGKGVVVLPTSASLPPIKMQFLTNDRYLDTGMLNFRPSADSGFPTSPGGYRNVWAIDADGSARLQAGEQEHCDDIRLAFYLTLYRFAEVVNEMTKQGSVYVNEAAARAALAKQVKIDPANVVAYFQCVAKWMQNERDTKRWHTPALPPVDSIDYDSKLREQVAIRRLTGRALPELNKHSSWDLMLNGAAPACVNLTTLSPAPAATPAQPGAAIQRCAKDTDEPRAVPPIVHEVLREDGAPLDAATRAFFEPRFGHDFSQVRVHSDARAAQSADAVNALAYTVGPDVTFATGRYAPHTNEGRKLLAHELTHVRQQAGLSAGAGSPLSLGPSTDPLERDADHTAMQIAWNGPSHQPSSSRSAHFAPATLQRAPAAEPVSPDSAARALSQKEITEAIKFNGKMLKNPSLLTIVREVIGIPKTPAISDQEMVLAVARYQAANGLAQDGKVDEVTVTFIIEELQAKGDNASTAAAESLKGPYPKRVQATGALSKRMTLLDVDASYCQCREQLKTGIERSKFLITEYQTCGSEPDKKTGTDIENCVAARSKERGEKRKLLGETDPFGTITIFPQSGPCGPLIDRITLAHEQTHAMHNRELLQNYGDPTTLRGLFGGAKKFNRAYNDPARWVRSEVSSRETEIAVARWAIGILDRICP